MKVAVYQSRTGIDPDANAAKLVRAVEAAADSDAAMLFTPEMSNLLDRNRERAASHIVAEANDPVLAAVRDAAKRRRIWVHLGSLSLADERGGRRFVNRSFVIDEEGTIRARYDKIHLFDVDLSTGESWRESDAYAAGRRAVVVDTPIGRLGLSICYDLRFSDLYRRLTDSGATVLAIPAAFTIPTGEAHWHILARARAIEAGVYVVAAAQCGRHEDGRETYGHSLVVDPWGDIVLDAEDETGVYLAELDAERIQEVRRHVPAIRHRRPIPVPELH
jgi:predicted amidohydrolase